MYWINLRLMEQESNYMITIDTYKIIRAKHNQKVRKKVTKEYRLRTGYHWELLFQSDSFFGVATISNSHCVLTNDTQVKIDFYEAMWEEEGCCPLRNPYELP